MAAKSEEHEISFICTTFSSSTVPKLSESKRAPIFVKLRWPEGKTELKVFFKAKPNEKKEEKMPTWRMISAPLQPLLNPPDLLNWANIWNSFGENSIPKFVRARNEENSDIRVLLSTSGNLLC